MSSGEYDVTYLQDDTGPDEASTPLAKDDTHGITIVEHTHVLELEVDHDPAGQVTQSSETNGGNDTTDHTETFEDRRVREQTKSDTLLSQRQAPLGHR